MALKPKQQQFVDCYHAMFGVESIATGAEIRAVVKEHDLTWPQWLTGPPEYRDGRGAYKLAQAIAVIGAKLAERAARIESKKNPNPALRYPNAHDRKKFQNLFEAMMVLCSDVGWKDPFSYARGKEIYAAIESGHEVASTYSGEDAIDETGALCEYKSTTGANISGLYSGLSVQKSWNKQELYLRDEKIGPYKHVINRFDATTGKLVEQWELAGQDVFRVLLPRLKRSWATRKDRKDPRLGATLSTNAIHQYGVQTI